MKHSESLKSEKIVTAFNKIDICDSENTLKDLVADRTVKISAKTGDGIENMLDVIRRGDKLSLFYFIVMFIFYI